MAKTILKAENLKKHYYIEQGIVDKILRRDKKKVRAVDGVNFDIERNKSMAVVGESGCGKTTLGKVVMRILEPTGGKMIMDGTDIADIGGGDELKAYRRKTQMIYQDPFSSIDPRFTVFDALEEPLLIHNSGKDIEDRKKMIKEALKDVKLTPPEKFIDRYPHMLSGGQKQRVSVARALMLDPSFIVADEPTSMLDVSVRAEILNLLKDLMNEHDLSFLYITHDISTSRFFSDYIAVMYLGKFVEKGKVGTVLDDPLHPYSKALLKAVPEPKPELVNEFKELPLKGEVPDATNLPSGCRFHPRCPYSEEICEEKKPQLREVDNREVACHIC